MTKRYFILCLSLLSTIGVYGKDSSMTDQTRALESILRALVPNKRDIHKSQVQAGHHAFAVDTCEIPRKKWIAFVLMGKPIDHRFQFKPGCDVQGPVRITPKPFPINLSLRNLPDFTQVHFMSALELKPDLAQGAADVLWSARNGILSGSKSAMEFTADYTVTAAMTGGVINN